MTSPSYALLGLLTVTLCACSSRKPPSVQVASADEIGVVGQDSLILGRDGGWGASVFGREVFVCGDTFVTKSDPGATSLHTNSFSFTDDTDASDGIAGLTEPVDSSGSPLLLVPPTPDETTFDDAHAGSPCAEAPCGARWALWPGATVEDPARDRALIAYGLVLVGSSQSTGGGQSIAVWNHGEAQAERPTIGRCADHPTLLFCDDEPGFADSLVVDGDQLYGITCPASGFLSSTCLLARAPLADALDPTQWQAWNGSSFGALSGATPILEGALNPRFFHDDYAGTWMAIYSTPESNEVDYRTAPALTGPWSDGAQLFVATDPNPTYDAYVQPDYSEDGGRVVYVTFSRSTSEFGSEIALERVVLVR